MDTDILLKRERLAKKICAELNNFVDLRNILNTILRQLKEVTGFEAVSIRLQEDGDFPFYVHEGFSSAFIHHENFISSTQTGENGGKNGRKNQLDCLCGKVIRGTGDKSLPYYTNKGSYWTNSSTFNTPLLEKTEQDVTLRNYCNACGYESIGLFPIKAREENIGLIQLNDKRKHMFSTDIVEFVEMIGEQIGVAIENAILYEKIKEKNIELQHTVDELNTMQDRLLEIKKINALADLVTGITHEIYQPITSALIMLDKVLNSSRELADSNEQSRDKVNAIIADEKEIYYNLNSAQSLIKSFRSLAMDQFQESRHLINLKSFLQDVIRVLKPSLKNKDINFTIDCNENSELLTFSGVLSQALSILIQNAYAHAFKDKSRGQITISCSVADEDFLLIKFSDNGKGIDASIQHKIFEPFFTTERKQHTGLGLSMASNIISGKLKGNISLGNSSDAGSTFVIKIPI